MTPKKVGFIVFEQMAADELTGPAEAFSRARISINDETDFRCYQVRTLGIGTKRCVTECGVVVEPELNINDSPPLDTLIIPGGAGIHNGRVSKRIAKWLSRRVSNTRRIAALGTGIYALAATGLLDRRDVAVHWRLAKDIASRFPRVQVTPGSLFIRDDRFYTCAGGASAVDLALSLIEEDYGRPIALKLARELVVHLKRSGEQDQYSDVLRFQVQSCDRFAGICTWILCNLSQNLSVEALAQKVCMSPRNFTRLFKAAFGKAPAEFVASARMAEAQRRLEIPRNSIEAVASSVGFRSADAFSRAFERELGCRPSAYRALLGVSAKEHFLKQQSKDLESVLVPA
jgi:transcriptional regulator GlxA family with amidase domain